MIAPIVPFVSEEIYTKLTGDYSVHTSDFPKYDLSKVDKHIERKMDLVRKLISVGRYVREEAKIKVRQPLSEALIDGVNEELISDLVPLIKEELNVKNITFASDLGKYMNFSIKPNFKEVGKLFGSKIKLYADKLNELTVEDINTLRSGNEITMDVDGEITVNKDMVDIRIDSKEGFNVGMDGNDFIILNTTLTEELLREGIARELVSKVQQLRKNKDFDIVDRITLYYKGDEEVNASIKDFNDYIKEETLAVEIVEKDDLTESYDLNGHNILIDVERVSK